MRRLALCLSLLALCAACAGDPAGTSPVGGVASYDALKQARDACVARGGELVQRPQTSGQRMADYGCKRK
ncbi:MAG: hypothetical protein ACK41C_14890 [Phenylobacterium sp.]|uniref:hypothetical protein n=1 Tax=Phenylobacterium sp. TaxID=1871053 RepID=UPI003919C2DC